MKAKLVVIIVSVLLAASGCQRSKPVVSVQQLDFTPGWSMLQKPVLTVPDDVELLGPPCPEYIHVHREWKDLPNSVFPFGAPSKKMVEKWKRQFETANDADSVWFNDFRNCRGSERWFAVNDLIELNCGPDADEDDPRTLWRLLQYYSGYKEVPSTKVEKILYLRESIDTLLNYYAGSQMDMNLRAYLETDLNKFYCRLTLRTVSEHMPSDLRSALQQEEQAWKKYYEQVSEDYEYLFDSPEGIQGSGWPVFVSWYLGMHLQLRRVSLEDLMFTMLEADDAVRKKQTPHDKVTSSMIAEEYEHYIQSLVEDEYSYPLAIQKEALNRDRKTWEKWLACRAAVSALLPSKKKVVYDRCTDVMRRYKFIMLKNRYENPDVYDDPESRGLIPFE